MAPSCEDRVGALLEQAIGEASLLRLLAYHPPSAKSYAYDQFPIPVLNEHGYRVGRRRYHIDLITVSSDALILIELKCQSSESEDDVRKLLRIKETYGAEGLKSIIAARLTTRPQSVLAGVTALVLAIGVERANHPTPRGVGLVEASQSGIRWVQFPTSSPLTRESLDSISLLA